MRIVFLSNYYNHHQSALSEALAGMRGVEYFFIATEPMEEERRKLGWSDDNAPSFVKYAYWNEAECIALTDSADVAILGAAPQRYVIPRLLQRKLTFSYSERFYKKGLRIHNFPLACYEAWLYHGRFQKYPYYMLCASAYTPCDCAVFGNYKGRMYKWGYFPEIRCYDIDSLISKKQRKEKLLLLWVGRLIDWKHPEEAIEVARALKQEHVPFQMVIIGTGEMEVQLRDRVKAFDLEDDVQLTGSMSPNAVRSYMEKADIFFSTSDHNEGWGVVINEAMNSGCAVVASHAMGAVPYLIRNGSNGLIYQSGDTMALLKSIKTFMADTNLRRRMGKNAYDTMSHTWNPSVAAERLVKLSKALSTHPDSGQTLFSSGPCSRAEVIWQKDMFRTLMQTPEKME